MATRCGIGINRPDETGNNWRIIYCHHDGNPSGVGKMLADFWRDREAAADLIALGSISELGASLDATVAYCRDRGEPMDRTRPFEAKTREEIIKAAANWGSRYIYLQQADNSWETINEF
jgi:hypothetical protein